MVHRLWLTLFVVTVCHVYVLQATGCEPSCIDTSLDLLGERRCLPPSTMVEDPKNCSQYYFCLSNCQVTQYPLPCPSGEGFDPVSGKCDASMAKCDPSCKPGICHLTCNGTGDLIGDPFDCNLYYICFPSGPIGPQKCEPEAPYFNGEGCVVEPGECCEPDCTPWCEAIGTQVPDPLDCHKYYICVKAGVVPDESVHFSCASSEVFNVALGRCVPGTDCTPFCPAKKSSPAGTPSLHRHQHQ